MRAALIQRRRHQIVQQPHQRMQVAHPVRIGGMACTPWRDVDGDRAAPADLGSSRPWWSGLRARPRGRRSSPSPLAAIQSRKRAGAVAGRRLLVAGDGQDQRAPSGASAHKAMAAATKAATPDFMSVARAPDPAVLFMARKGGCVQLPDRRAAPHPVWPLKLKVRAAPRPQRANRFRNAVAVDALAGEARRRQLAPKQGQGAALLGVTEGQRISAAVRSAASGMRVTLAGLRIRSQVVQFVDGGMLQPGGAISSGPADQIGAGQHQQHQRPAPELRHVQPVMGRKPSHSPASAGMTTTADKRQRLRIQHALIQMREGQRDRPSREHHALHADLFGALGVPMDSR